MDIKINTKTLSDQVRQEIINLIKKDYSFNGKLPSEQQLANMMGVSRNTVREALKSLENDGIVMSRHGIGTFITSTLDHLKHNIVVLNSTTDIISNNGYEPGTKSIYFDCRKATSDIQKLTGLPENQEYLYIERVRTANDSPIAYVEDYIPVFEGLVESFSSDIRTPLFPFFEKQGLSISFSNSTIHAVLSDDKLQEHLNLSKVTSLLLLKQCHYSDKGDMILYSDSYFLSDKLEMSLVRHCVD